jgi:serine protease Do
MARAFGELAERLRRSTVEVRLRDAHANANAGGSGVIATADGQIVTNAHVARGAGASVRLWDGRELPAKLLARDARRDLATLKVEAGGLPAATFGDSGALRVGELVMAIGNPMGFIGALTTGVVHALGSLAGFGRQGWVLADVRLAPGNSGGPLADTHGRVIGINTMIVNGLGAAVPGDAVTAFLRRGASGFSLGVTVQPVRLEDQRFGLLVLKVDPGSPAAAAPLWTGDVLTGAGGRAFRSVDDLHLLLDSALDSAGGVIHLQFLRGDRAATRQVAIRLARPVAEAA